MKNTLSFLSIVIFASMALAEKLTLSTHDSLIEKLESVVSMKSRDSMISQPKVALRLADLYAERARLLAMEKEGQGDQLFKTQIESDRKSAVKIYSEVLSETHGEEKGRVLLQMAHLYTLLRQTDEAVKIYLVVVKNPKEFEPATLAQAQIQLGDLRFAEGRFDEALALFEASLKISENPRRAYSMYRQAWCQFNRGDDQIARSRLEQLLRDKKLFVKKSGGVDSAFEEEVSHDLATFMARREVQESDVHRLASLSSPQVRQKNLIFLAQELSRTGKKRSALLVWKVVGKTEISFEDQLEGQIEVTKIQYDLGAKAQILVELKKSLQMLKDSRCNENADCEVQRQNLRRVITDWGKAEERIPSAELIQAYSLYTAQYEDFEMCYWAGNASLRRKSYSTAYNLFERSARILSQAKSRAEDPRQQKIFEGSLLNAIEAAESSQIKSLDYKSYSLYLELNPQGPQRDSVLYQQAHWHYKHNQTLKAAEMFRALALSPNTRAELRNKSADLCLDSDVLLKNEAAIEKDSWDFSQSLVSRKSEFLAIWRKSILNQSAQIINRTNSPSEILEGEWKKLQSLNLESWPALERKKVVKNKLLLSYRLKELNWVASSAQELLRQPALTVEEKNLALKSWAWVAEMRFDFSGALRLLRQLKVEKTELASHHYKLALLSELAGQDPSTEYLQFLKSGRENSKRAWAGHQLILASNQPQRAYRRYEALLSSNAALKASAALWVFERTHNQKISQEILNTRAMRSTPEALILKRSLALKEVGDILKKIQSVKITAGSDATLRRKILMRIEGLRQLETATQKAIRQKDNTLQLVLLTHVAGENQRLANDLLALPIPRSLKGEAQKKYQEQMQTQVQPYQQQAALAQGKAHEMWEDVEEKSLFKDLVDWSQQSQRPGSTLAKSEVEVLRRSSRQIGFSDDPFKIFTQKRHKMVAEAQSLQKSISKNPFDFNDLNELKNIQTSLGVGPLVAYLETRVSEMKSQGSGN